MNRHIIALQQVARRTITSSARRPVNRVPEKQKLFQEDNGLPIHLKGGTADAVLYRATVALTVIGTLYAFYELGKAVFPPKKR